jgi:hypothetical protein
MAGGWEEVVAVGSGIGTGAGTSVKLKKNARRTRLLKILVGRTGPLKAKNCQAGPLLNRQTVFG